MRGAINAQLGSNMWLGAREDTGGEFKWLYGDGILEADKFVPWFPKQGKSGCVYLQSLTVLLVVADECKTSNPFLCEYS